jgi:hypothetical protein
MFMGSTTPIRERYPRLFSYVLDDKLSVQDILTNPDLATLFHLPLSVEALTKFQTIIFGLQSLQRNDAEHDVWSRIPGKEPFPPRATI